MITSKNYDGVVMALVDSKTMKPIQVGEARKDFRGENEAFIISGSAPHREGTAGRIDVVWTRPSDGQSWKDVTTGDSYYPTVYGCCWTTHPAP